MRLAVLQSNYIPWKGYFDLLALSDLFVVYDSVQYTKNDWRNRNLIMTASGPLWLTIPVATAGRSEQRINEATISDRRWTRKHWASISQAFARRAHFAEYADEWESWYAQVADIELLHDVNVHFLSRIATRLGIDTPMVDDRAFDLAPDTPTGRLVQLCEAVGADRYLTGPAGLDYLELSRFDDAGVALDVIDYSAYPSYPQPGDTFDHGVSILDLVASVGAEGRRHLAGRFSTVAAPGRAAPPRPRPPEA